MKRLGIPLVLVLCAVWLVALAAPGSALACYRVRATVSDAHPVWHDVVAIRAKMTGPYGVPLSGARVVYTWHFKSYTKVMKDWTNANGVARVARNIYRAAPGYTVAVSVVATWHGQVVRTRASFVPAEQ